jgi:hypothetical protein
METTSTRSHPLKKQSNNQLNDKDTIQPPSSSTSEMTNNNLENISETDSEVAFELGDLGFDKYGNLVKW